MNIQRREKDASEIKARSFNWISLLIRIAQNLIKRKHLGRTFSHFNKFTNESLPFEGWKFEGEKTRKICAHHRCIWNVHQLVLFQQISSEERRGAMRACVTITTEHAAIQIVRWTTRRTPIAVVRDTWSGWCRWCQWCRVRREVQYRWLVVQDVSVVERELRRRHHVSALLFLLHSLLSFLTMIMTMTCSVEGKEVNSSVGGKIIDFLRFFHVFSLLDFFFLFISSQQQHTSWWNGNWISDTDDSCL